jgi:hypothetical protein
MFEFDIANPSAKAVTKRFEQRDPSRAAARVMEDHGLPRGGRFEMSNSRAG